MSRTGGISYLHTTTATGSAVGSFTLSTGAVQAGDLVLLRVVLSVSAIVPAPVVTDTSASTWSLLYSIQPQTGFQHFVYAATVAQDGTYTISGTFSRSDVSYAAQADAFGNAALPVHGTGTASGLGPAQSVTIPASTAGDLLYVAVMSQGTFGFTGLDTDWEPLSSPGAGTSAFTVAAYKLGSGGGAVSWSGTANDPAAGHAWWAVGFALTSAAPVVPPPPATGSAGTGRPTFSPGPFQPDPLVTIGSDVSATVPAGGVPDERIALAGFTVTWGRDRVLDQPEPATATVRLYYPFRSAPTAKNLTGQQVTLSYRGTLPGDTSPTRVRFFRGRVTTIKAEPRDIRLASGARQRGAIVTLQLVSVLTDLANITPDAVWPEETLEERRARIQAAAAGRVTVDVRDYWKTPNVVPYAADSQRSLYDHATALYDSCGVDRMTFLPDEGMNGALRPVLRRDYAGLRGLAGLVRPGADEGRAGTGAYVRPLSVYPADGDAGDAAVPVYLDAAALEYDPADGLELGLDNRITRVAYTNPDNTRVTAGTIPEPTVAAQLIRDRMNAGDPLTADWTWTGAPAEVVHFHQDLHDANEADGYDPADHDQAVIWLAAYIAGHPAVGSYASRTVTRTVSGMDEITQGVRAATATTDVCWNSWANVAAAQLRSVCAGEAAAWALQPLQWEVTRTGGFESAEQAQLLLAGAETNDLVFLQRSWLPMFGLRPVFGVMGGTISYDDGWRMELSLAPVRPPTVKQHPISWEEIDDGTAGHTVRWHDGEHADGLHESVTYEDLGHCALGVGVTTIPADSGWDQ